MSGAEEALLVVRLPAGVKTVARGKIPELIGIAVYGARFGKFDAKAAHDEIWQYIPIFALKSSHGEVTSAHVLEVVNEEPIDRTSGKALDAPTPP